MAMSCNKLPRKLITTISGTACRFRLEVEFEEGRLHKLSKASTGRSLTRLACVQQLFESFIPDSVHLRLDANLLLLHPN
jgi:hypothetical protein